MCETNRGLISFHPWTRDGNDCDQFNDNAIGPIRSFLVSPTVSAGDNSILFQEQGLLGLFSNIELGRGGTFILNGRVVIDARSEDTPIAVTKNGPNSSPEVLDVFIIPAGQTQYNFTFVAEFENGDELRAFAPQGVTFVQSRTVTIGQQTYQSVGSFLRIIRISRNRRPSVRPNRPIPILN